MGKLWDEVRSHFVGSGGPNNTNILMVFFSVIFILLGLWAYSVHYHLENKIEANDCEGDWLTGEDGDCKSEERGSKFNRMFAMVGIFGGLIGIALVMMSKDKD